MRNSGLAGEKGWVTGGKGRWREAITHTTGHTLLPRSAVFLSVLRLSNLLLLQLTLLLRNKDKSHTERFVRSLSGRYEGRKVRGGVIVEEWEVEWAGWSRERNGQRN